MKEEREEQKRQQAQNKEQTKDAKHKHQPDTEGNRHGGAAYDTGTTSGTVNGDVDRSRACKYETQDKGKNQQGKNGNMCESCVTTFDTKEDLTEHEARHREARREATKEEKWALSVMLQQEGILDPCPPHLKGAYRICSTRTAKQIEQEDSRVVANFVQHMVEDQAKAENTGGNRHREEIRPKDKHEQKGKDQESRRQGDGTGGEGAEHQDEGGKGKKDDACCGSSTKQWRS